MTPGHLLESGWREAIYRIQTALGVGHDRELARRLGEQAARHLAGVAERSTPVVRRRLDELALHDDSRYSLHRADVYRRFEPLPSGRDHDRFGRQGEWVPRGTTVFYDRIERAYVKTFDEHAVTRGEAAFLGTALERGLYDFLCPNLTQVFVDDGGRVRGYSISEGRQLTRVEFDQYVGVALRPVILEETARTGLYFYDLAFHNVVLSGDRISVIDLESVLPIAWYATDDSYTVAHRDELDVGWSLQSKWQSPEWYDDFLGEHTKRDRRSVVYESES